MDKPNSKKPQFHIKAIETRYDGYRFRSRLESRWATFFNALKIPYRYEPDGFVLEGTPYLPDFYLPQFDCFVEIKGVEPTEDELRKARLLCLYSMKRVYLFAGEVGKDKYGRSAYRFNPPGLGAWNKNSPTREKNAPVEVLWTMQRLTDAEFEAQLNEQQDDIILKPSLTWTSEFDSEITLSWEDICWYLAEKGRGLIAAMNLLQKHRSQVIEALKPEHESDQIVWAEMTESVYYAWGKCTNCSALVIGMEDEHYNYHCGCHAEIDYDAPEILTAYQAAREARF